MSSHSRNSSCVGTLRECLQRDHALNHMCNQSNRRARRHRRGDVVTRKLKSTCGGAGISFLSFSKLSVCVSVRCESYLVLSVKHILLCPRPYIRQSIRAIADHVSGSVSLPALATLRAGIQTSCACSLSREPIAHIVLEGASVSLPEGSLRGGSFH